MARGNDKEVLVIGTLDTKSDEFAYLMSCLKKQDLKTILMDGGILGTPRLKADISPEEVARAAGSTLDAVRLSKGEGDAIAAMMKGATRKALDMYNAGRLSGVISMGGSMGTSLGTAVMRALPFGIPKVMLSIMASGNTSAFIGTRDIVMLHSVADIIGLNRITRRVIEDAALTIAGMVKGVRFEVISTKKLVSLTTKGTQEGCVQAVRKGLEYEGYEVVTFSASGTGGDAMEELIAQGEIDMVIDLCLFEVINSAFGGIGIQISHSDRLMAAINRKIPMVVAPGCIEFFVEGPYEQTKQMYPDKPLHIHNPAITVVRYSSTELARFGMELARKLNIAQGPVAVVIPLKGFSVFAQPGHVLCDLEADSQFTRTLKANIKSSIPVIEVDANINDPAFSNKVLETFFGLVN